MPSPGWVPAIARMENTCLIVGLGNPGAQYASTRHNAGFLVVDRLAARWKLSLGLERKFNARLAWTALAGLRVGLCQPQTYMNHSGEAVAAVAGFYRIDPARVLIVVDDADLPLGHLRLRPNGSSGGHHGLESVEAHLGSRDYPRLRVGIGRRDATRQISGYVLGKFDPTEASTVEKILMAAADQAQTWLTAGIQKAMNQFNGAVEGTETERKEQ